MEIRSLRQDERGAVQELLRGAFGPATGQPLDTPPPLGPDRTLVAVDDVPLGCALTFTRTVRLRRTEVRLGGVGGVAVRADRRRNGIGSALLQAAMDELRKSGSPIGLLFTDGFGFYERAGWRQLSQRLFKLRPHGAAVEDGAALRELAPADLGAVCELYDAYTATLSGVTLRDAPYWGALARRLEAGNQRLRIAEQDGRVVAYVWSEARADDQVAVLEYARERGAAPALVDLLLSELEGRSVLRAPIVPDPELGHALRERGCAPDPGEDPSPMWTVLDPEQLAAIAGLPQDVSQRALLDALVGGPSATYFESDRF